MKHEADTIFALASAPGRAGIAVIRVSGPKADQVLRDITRREVSTERNAVLRPLFHFMNDVQIDTAVVLRFCAPNSYTGENVVEFHVHGGRAIQVALLSTLAKMSGLRFAEAGEFTRRAVENGRLDLTRAEAIADLVDAETEAQRRQAFRQYDGRLATLYEDWRAQLIRGAAWIEAGIDFAEDEVPEGAIDNSRTVLARVAHEIRAHLDDGRRGEILREGFQVAVIGPPNSGKSSLVNALARRDVAIVSETAGTTRDIIEVRLDLGGYPVILIDTAGLRDSSDPVEREGVRRARERAANADLRLLVLDGAKAFRPVFADADGRADVIVCNKADLVTERAGTGLWVSARTGEGMDSLIGALTELAAKRLAPSDSPVLTRTRHRKSLEVAELAISAALVRMEPELAAEHLRIALGEIGRITGRVDLDELLDVVFRDFCIGK